MERARKKQRNHQHSSNLIPAVHSCALLVTECGFLHADQSQMKLSTPQVYWFVATHFIRLEMNLDGRRIINLNFSPHPKRDDFIYKSFHMLSTFSRRLWVHIEVARIAHPTSMAPTMFALIKIASEDVQPLGNCRKFFVLQQSAEHYSGKLKLRLFLSVC